MKNATIFTLTAGVGSLILASAASAEIVVDDMNLSADLTHLGDTPDGAVGGALGAYVATYRIYADIGAGWRLDAVFGNGDNLLSIHAADGLSFYQNALGGNTSVNINAALLPLYGSLNHDSWVTIGLDNSTDNALNVVGNTFDNWLETDNGSWFVTPDDVQGEAVDGRVLIAQLSIVGGSGVLDDDFSSMTVNLQGKTDTGETWKAWNVSVPAPGALALLGVAGLATRRRRK